MLYSGSVVMYAMWPFDRPKMKTRENPNASDVGFHRLPDEEDRFPGTGTISESLMRIAWNR